MDTKVYQKENSQSIFKLLVNSLKDISGSLFLAKQLAKRDIKAQYRQSYLGLVWAFLTPLTTALIWVILNNTGTIEIEDTGIPYVVFAFSGSLIWSVLMDSINSPLVSLKESKSLISKINFPKEALIVAGLYKMLFNSSIKIVLMLALLVFYNINIGYTILLFPFSLIAIILFGTTVGLIITPIGMLYNDISKIISMGLRLLMYITPVVYGVAKTGIMKTLMEANPLTPLILTSRNLLIGYEIEYMTYYFVIMIVTVPLFLIALVFYRISVPIIVERVGA